MIQHRRLPIVLALILSLLLIALLSACGAENREPDDVRYVKSKEDLQKVSKNVKYIQRTLFLSDANGLLVPQTVGLPETNSPARQVLEYLVQDGPITELLPNGFQAILPADTEVKNVAIDRRGNLTADFSKEFLEARAQDQEKTVQSVVWTLTQLDNVKSVTLKADGKTLDEWPDSGRAIGKSLTRADGINTMFGGVADVTGSEALTVYYLTANKEKSYAVPVTIRNSGEQDKISSLVAALIHEPAGGDFISTFNPSTRLLEKPVIKDGTVSLHFNNAIYEDKASKTISDQALRCLVLTLTGEPKIEKVSIRVGDSKKVTLESGKTFTGPVSRSMVSASAQ